MPRYHFHLENGEISLDPVGSELRDLDAAKHVSLLMSGDLLKGGPDATASLWNGIPWRLWVTDEPAGSGNAFFILRFSAEMGPQ